MSKKFIQKIDELFSQKKKVVLKEIYRHFGATTKDKKKSIKERILQLIEEGYLIQDSAGHYFKPSREIATGTIEFTRSGNIAFVKTENGEEIAVMVEDANGAIHMDKVMVEIIGKWRNLPKGKVIKILKREKREIVGVLQLRRSRFYLTPDDPKINFEFVVNAKTVKGIRPGLKVVAKIVKWPRKNQLPEVEIVQILGDAEDPRIDIPSVIAKHSLRVEFPEEVMKEVAELPDDVTKEDLIGRVDCTDEIVFTIDGEDAKDFDDAVSIKKVKDKYLLSVHIADVSHYVKEGSALDKEAFLRGTSVYLLDTVIPMFPFKLSNDLCSLVEGKIRLTFTVQMLINKDGETLDYKVFPSYIKSKKRLTYTLVNRYFEGDEEAKKILGKEICRSLDLMLELSQILREYRKARGAILDIEGGEVKVILGKDYSVVDIVPVVRGKAEILIEEFMIKANETVANIFHEAGLPFVYRVHEEPDPETLVQLKEYVEALGIGIKFPKKIDAAFLQKILEAVKNHPLRSSVERLLVRSMKRALYSATNIGHFGLASFAYTHFTSPIRRYPDLVVHRLLKIYLKQKGKFTPKQIQKFSEELPKIAEHCSRRERVADEAEWDLIAIKKVEYIKRFIGKIFNVVVTNVTHFGLFVEIPEKLISGLIHISTLDDYYYYDEKKNILVGERTGKVFKIGDVIKARVINADKATGEIDFEYVGDEKQCGSRNSREKEDG
nr:ribonuclease R [Pseudothermotoga thermarum]